MQSQNMTLLVHANLGPQMYCYYFGIRGFKIYKHKYRSDRETKKKAYAKSGQTTGRSAVSLSHPWLLHNLHP